MSDVRNIPLVVTALLAAILVAGCATYPSARDLARVTAGDSTGRFQATAMPQNQDYDRLCGSVIEIEGTIAAVEDAGPVRLTLDRGVIAVFAKDNEESALACTPGQRVVLKGIARWDPERRGWLSPAQVLALPSAR